MFEKSLYNDIYFCLLLCLLLVLPSTSVFLLISFTHLIKTISSVSMSHRRSFVFNTFELDFLQYVFAS